MKRSAAVTVDAALRERLAHVRWVAGGTGAGKTTLVQALADGREIAVYDGDAGERNYAPRCTPDRQPLMCAMRDVTPRQRWLGRTPEEFFNAMPSLHGETFPFVLDDLLQMASDRPLLVDDFRTLPSEVSPLLSWREQAVFLLPTDDWRRNTLSGRYSDPVRARINWAFEDPTPVLEARFARDRLWDDEVRRQAAALDLWVLEIDGTRSLDDLVAEVRQGYRLRD
jgi:hypothetical protein